MAKKRSKDAKFALCISDAEPDLEFRTVYRVVADDSASKSQYLRVVDESGEDYLYPAKYFMLVDAPVRAKRSGPPLWWVQIAGTFAGDPAHDEAARLGRKYGQGHRPKTRKRRSGST
jgi:hypothetical protein